VDCDEAILTRRWPSGCFANVGEYRSLGVTRDEMMRHGAAGFMENLQLRRMFGLLDSLVGGRMRVNENTFSAVVRDGPDCPGSLPVSATVWPCCVTAKFIGMPSRLKYTHQVAG